jgi:hypothetical protein
VSGWQPPTDAPPQAPAPQWTQPNVTNSNAVAALVLGICGLVICPVILSIPAVIMGYKARNEIDAKQGQEQGRGMAIAGIITGWIGIVLGVLGILFAVFALALIEPSDAVILRMLG